MIKAVVFDCDGVLSDNGSSWQMIHRSFGTGEDDGGEHQEALEMFLDGKISEEEFVAHDIKLWREVRPDIHRDDIMRCYSGVGLIEGARKVVENLKKRGVFVAIVSLSFSL